MSCCKGNLLNPVPYEGGSVLLWRDPFSLFFGRKEKEAHSLLVGRDKHEPGPGQVKMTNRYNFKKILWIVLNADWAKDILWPKLAWLGFFLTRANP